MTKLIYPLRYHYSRHSSDRDFVLKRMAVIPPEEQQAIADEYEKLFLSGEKDSRRKANEYLHKKACEYRDKRKTA